MIKKTQTTYTFYVRRNEDYDAYDLVVSEETPDHVCVCTVEPCDGVLRHWGTRKELVDELKQIISVLENSETV
jgi:hypothetical protein